MTRILLFGAAGQLGREVTALAAARGLDLVGLDHAALDISDPVAVARALEAARPDALINAAAYTAVDKAESEPERAARINAFAPGLIAERCARYGTPLIHVSTDYVFDGTKAGAYVEADPVHPVGVYGRTKAAGEAAIRAAHERHVIVRTSWVYGAYGNNFLKTMLRLAGERDELKVVADQRGCPTATRDLAEALLAVAEAAAKGDARFGTYHFAGTGATTWHGFAAAIVAAAEKHTGRRPRVTPITTADYPTPARRPKNSALASDLFERSFGVRAAPWERRVIEVVDALLAETAAAQSPVEAS
ncbi:dTDP-4-dehydrorhamnose reductase [Xanthobacter dioxanivorans]|uniref:dTDP-4-dehydrorhamnose reductase n=1 Tax=Xanthobacter dioxanivorans TaxID=2528964 RepID=A0A974PK51_9HYPH|nr:dTDP-4-dehydrorhamnose reductase [Xanthobacter dioxanivorans]QRG05082.1 dTDP-4-dehydrorhamnose reductase [Xanthobacter dioxanivorans]